jgi:hypothetical protein
MMRLKKLLAALSVVCLLAGGIASVPAGARRAARRPSEPTTASTPVGAVRVSGAARFRVRAR